jgi:hypothetical protein
VMGIDDWQVRIDDRLRWIAERSHTVNPVADTSVPSPPERSALRE